MQVLVNKVRSFLWFSSSLHFIEKHIGGLIQVIVASDQHLLHSLSGETHVCESLNQWTLLS